MDFLRSRQISLDKFNVSRVHGHLVERGIHGDPVSQVGFGPRMIVEFLSAVNQTDVQVWIH